MARYFFHLHNDITAIDEEGSHWPDDHAAMDHAVHCARELAGASVREGHLGLNHHIDVLSEEGRTIGTISFGSVVKIMQ